MTKEEKDMLEKFSHSLFDFALRLREARDMGILTFPQIELDENGFVNDVSFPAYTQSFRDAHGITNADMAKESYRVTRAG